MPKFVLLWTDAVMWALVVALLVYARVVWRSPNLRASWTLVFRDAAAFASAIVLGLCLVLTLLDSAHFRRALPTAAVADAAVRSTAYDTRTQSVLDALLVRMVESREATYSRPLAYQSFTLESLTVDGEVRRLPPRLLHGGAHLRDPVREWSGDIAMRVGGGLALGAIAALLLGAWIVRGVARRHRWHWREAASRVLRDETDIRWRAALMTLTGLCLLAAPAALLMNDYHLLGTDRTGNDVFYQALKSIRTAFVIGTLATVATLPLAVGLGLMAGYFKGWVDEAIQYLYTVLSSVPNVLLIAACVLMVQVYLDQHPELFETGAERADLKLFLLCAILGVTGWAGLCRLLRAETLKLRELEYVQAATAFGVGPWRIMARYLMPNVMHLVLITTVLDFSGLILYEAVLSYVGVGVDPSMNSFGGMINLARSEMSRDPVVWWSFAAAFGFMVTVVLAANFFADGVRDAFDPRARVFRARRLKKPALAPSAVDAALRID
ncbi:MAG: ABC transporter permease [Pseudomonadota bacterium]|nr:ABC transporter permease [Pseudomonadota bacterium]